MNISQHYKEYLSFVDQHARDSFQTEGGNHELSFSKDFLKTKEPVLEPQLYRRLESELLGVGPIESLIQDPNITEIIANSYQHIFYEKNGQLKKHERGFSCPASYHSAIERICHEAGVELNTTKPHCDGSWRGFRLHMLRSPLVKEDTKISLRRNSQHSWCLEKLTQAKWCTEQQKQQLKKLVDEKTNVLVIGPTNTGKTTCINACLQNTKDCERVLFIEDTDELALPNEVSAKLLTREDYSQQDLLHQCLRMRPDRIVVGEVRGPEAKDYLMALATGHRGAWSSLHAESPRQALHRLEMLIQMAQPQWKSESVRQLIKMGIDVIISLENTGGLRRLRNIHLITSLEKTGFCLEEIEF